jgi:hypothetical protein
VGLGGGVRARRGAGGGGGYATAGLTTGGVALAVTAVWFVSVVAPFWGDRTATSIRAGETAVEMVQPPETGVVEAPATPAPDERPDPDAEPGPDAEPDPIELLPGDAGPPRGALEDGTGDVTLSLDGDELHLELTDCALGDGDGRGSLRGTGPDGRLLLRSGDHDLGHAGLLLVVEPDGASPRVLVGQVRGYTEQRRSTMFDRRRIELDGELRDALDDEPVAVSLLAACS